MDAAQWPPFEEIVATIPSSTPDPKSSSSNSISNSNGAERKPRPQKEQALNCPRCDSANTKFCYYNNYSLTQPRYFCKTCRRYWTEGGSLRNIPVGGGSRKNKSRPSSSHSSTSTSSSSTSASSCSGPSPIFNPLLGPHHVSSAPRIRVSSSSAAISTSARVCNGQYPSKDQDLNDLASSSELLNSKGLLSSFISMPLSLPNDQNDVYTPPPPPTRRLFLGFHEVKPAGGLSFPPDGISGGFPGALYESAADMNNGCGRLLFPFEELKEQTNDSGEHQDIGSGKYHPQHHNRPQQEQASDHDHHPSNGFWGGMLGGGSW